MVLSYLIAENKPRVFFFLQVLVSLQIIQIAQFIYIAFIMSSQIFVWLSSAEAYI